MGQVIKKENLTISIREYPDNNGQTKKVWKTIGEIITWDEGKQSFELWGPGGLVKGSVFEQQDKQGTNNANQNQNQTQAGSFQNQQPNQQQQQAQNNFQQPQQQGQQQVPPGEYDDDLPF